MLRRILGMVVTALTLGMCAACVGQSQGSGSHRNLGELKIELLKYQQFGAYMAEVAKVDQGAKAYVLKRMEGTARPAIVLDIDETSLSNWPEIVANDFGYIPSGGCDALPKGPCGTRAWEISGMAEAIGPTLDLYNAAINAGVAVFFITGRDESERTATESNLRAVGFRKWQRVILRPIGSKTASAADFKAPERAKIEAEGYTIIANIGDQPSDLAGGHAERGFLLPNPFYRIL